ncbi:hypothetical protein Tco_0783935 [Tanacetum coccineum]
MADYRFYVDSKRGARMVPFVSKGRVPETWTEASNKVHVLVSNAQYAKFVVAKPCKRPKPTEKFIEDKLINGVDKDLKFNDYEESYKRLEPTEKFTEDKLVDGVDQKDLKFNDYEETYIVLIDTHHYTTYLQKKLLSIYDKVLIVDNISMAKEVVN